MVYRSGCRYLPYSIHLSEFMAICFHEKMGKTREYSKPAIFVWYQNGRQGLLGAQSINSVRVKRTCAYSTNVEWGGQTVSTWFNFPRIEMLKRCWNCWKIHIVERPCPTVSTSVSTNVELMVLKPLDRTLMLLIAHFWLSPSVSKWILVQTFHT